MAAFQEGAEAGVTRLLAAFYFRQQGEHDGDKTFEFTHKSFGEYLASRRVVRTLRVLDRAITDHEEDPDRGKSIEESLPGWVDVCGPAALDEYYVRFLNREVQRSSAEDVARWQRRLAALMTHVVRHGMPMERAKLRSTFAEETRRSRNAEEALFACAAACSDVTGALTEVLWPSLTSFGSWLRRLQGQRHGAANRVVLGSLRRLSLLGCRLEMLDLYGADMRGCDLRSSELVFACLVNADLRGATFDDTSFDSVSLTRHSPDGVFAPNLWRAQLAGATVNGIDMIKALAKPSARRLSRKRAKHK